MRHGIFALLFLLLNLSALAQDSTYTAEDIKINQFVDGTLVVPNSAERPPLVIMIQGSGPTDRDGNQSFMKNNSLKKLSQGLAAEGIASFRFDKRILKMSQNQIKEEEMRFDDFVTDVNSIIAHFDNSRLFGKTIILGHSQGSLIGMLAGKEKADAFISIAGAAQSIDSIIIDQIALQMPSLKENVEQTFTELRQTGSSQNYNSVLESIFRPSVQPFILSWMQYNPKEEIANLNMPVLLINGNKDLQVMPSEAEALKAAYPEAELVILDKMNHVLRKIEGSELENSKSYNEPNLPLHPELIPTITEFIKNLK